MRLGARPQPHAGEQIQRDRILYLSAAGQAVRARVLGREAKVSLEDVRVLNMPVPGLLPGFLGILAGASGPGASPGELGALAASWLELVAAPEAGAPQPSAASVATQMSLRCDLIRRAFISVCGSDRFGAGGRAIVLLRTGEDSSELQADQGEENQQVNSQRPQANPNHRCRLNARHRSISGREFDFGVSHHVLVAHNAHEVIVCVHHRQHAELVFGKHPGQILAQGVPLGGDHG